MGSDLCGCCYCLEVYSPREITDRVDEDEHGVGTCALCAKCGIDSVNGATQGLDTDDADFIESVLAQWSLQQLSVDRRRLAESHEAWVHVLINEDARGQEGLPLQGFAPYPQRGILTWSNSD